MKLHAPLLICFSLFLSGCGGGPTPVAGGTSGSLTAGEIPVPDFEIKIYQAGSTVPLGLGTTGNDGKFQLVLLKGEGPLWLSPGDYSVTLESLGPETPRMPSAFGNLSKTPLKVKWKTEDKSLDLKIPAFK